AASAGRKRHLGTASDGLGFLGEGGGGGAGGRGAAAGAGVIGGGSGALGAPGDGEAPSLELGNVPRYSGCSDASHEPSTTATERARSSQVPKAGRRRSPTRRPSPVTSATRISA